jgi:hypothetical protein
MSDPNSFYSLPTTTGRTVVNHDTRRPANTGSGGIRPTPRGAGGTPSNAMGGSYTCMGCQKPGPEESCNFGVCYKDANFNE